MAMKQHKAKRSTRERTRTLPLLLWFQPAVPARQTQEILQVLQLYTLFEGFLPNSWVFGKENQAITSGLVLKLRQNSKRRWEPWAPRKCYIYKAPAPPMDSEMPTTASEQSSKEQTMQSVIPSKGPWQGCAPLSTHLCLLWKSAVPVKSSKLPRTQVLLMLDCSPAWQDSNRVTNTTANLSSSGEQGFQLTGSIQQLLLFCYFQTSSCCRWSSKGLSDALFSP